MNVLGWARPVSNGLRVGLIGYIGTVPVVIGALAVAGAQPQQIGGALFILGLCMGLPALLLSLRYRAPVSVAWSTAGAAVLVAHGPVHGGLPTAAGAFLIVGVLTLLVGVCRPAARWMARVPPAIVNAVLTGLLLGLWIAPTRAIAEAPALVAPVLAAWFLARRFARAWAIPAAVLAALAMMALVGWAPHGLAPWRFPEPTLVPLGRDVADEVALALPLFLVTMLSQNVPAFGILRDQGFVVGAQRVLLCTGSASIAGAFFGALGVSLAAVTAAMCAGEESGTDPRRRWVAALVAGLSQVALGVGSGAIAAWILSLPPALVGTLAGLALWGTLGSALSRVLRERTTPLAVGLSVAVTCAGAAIPGGGGAVWGLAAGLLLYGVEVRIARVRRGKDGGETLPGDRRP